MAILFHSDLDDPTEWRKAFKHFAPAAEAAEAAKAY